MIPFILILVGALCLQGIINKTRARLAGRTGVPFFQPLLSVGVLLRKARLNNPNPLTLNSVRH